MAKIKKNRILTRKELLALAQRIFTVTDMPTSDAQSADELFTALQEEIKKPPINPPPTNPE